jgi:hypothetical protein
MTDPTLPEATDRRALLRLIVSEAAPGTPTSSTEPSATLGQNDKLLLNVCQQLLDLGAERSRIVAEYMEARDRMNELAPLPPKPRPRKIKEGRRTGASS